MKKLLLSILAVILISVASLAQVAISTDGSLPDNSAMLDVKSTDKGLLIPRMTAAQRDANGSPATGLLIFCTDNSLYYSNNGTPASPNWLAVNSKWLSNGSSINFSGGNVGIGTLTPSTILDIGGGNNWDLQNGEGDFRIGNSNYRIKMGIALAGGGGGAAGIMQYGQTGGYNVLKLGAQDNYLLFLNGSTQKVGIGTDNPVATLDVIGSLRVADGSQGAGKVLTSDSTVDGVIFSEWYLPSKYELNLLYQQRYTVGGFAYSYYWTSTEADATTAWCQTFTQGFQGNYDKGYPFYIRVIRSF